MASKQNKVNQKQKNRTVVPPQPVRPSREQVTDPVAGNSMVYKKVLIYALAIVLLLVVRTFNASFFTERIGQYWEDYKEQRVAEMDPDSRKLYRYGNTYYISTLMARLLKEQHAGPDDVLLLPSTDYFRSVGLDFHVPEPPVFYYLVGVKSNWQSYKLEPMPKWFIDYRNKSFVIHKIQDKAQLDSILKILKPYPSKL